MIFFLIEPTVDVKFSQIKIQSLSSPYRMWPPPLLPSFSGFYLRATGLLSAALWRTLFIKVHRLSIQMKYQTLKRHALCQQVGNSLGSGPGVGAGTMIFLSLGTVWAIDSKKGRCTLEHAGPGNRDLSSCTCNHSCFCSHQNSWSNHESWLWGSAMDPSCRSPIVRIKAQNLHFPDF